LQAGRKDLVEWNSPPKHHRIAEDEYPIFSRSARMYRGIPKAKLIEYNIDTLVCRPRRWAMAINEIRVDRDLVSHFPKHFVQV
jgi:hypothetical protein